MKHLIKALILVIVTGVSINQMNASTLLHNPSEGPTSIETEKTIRNYFKFPQILLTVKDNKTIETNKVEVLFTTDKNGKVNFVLAKTENPELKKEIEKQFLALQLNQLKTNVVHKVILNFKTV